MKPESICTLCGEPVDPAAAGLLFAEAGASLAEEFRGDAGASASIASKAGLIWP